MLLDTAVNPGAVQERATSFAPSKFVFSITVAVKTDEVWPEEIRMVGGDRGPNVELFQYEAPDQDHTFRKNSDYGGKHIALYVRHIDKAVAWMESKGVEKLLGPLAVTDGPAAGQTINYFRAPFGTFVELISYPHGMAYESTAAVPLWDPRDNHP